MRKILVLLAVLALLACPMTVVAQTTADTDKMEGPPKILEIVRENSKPGKSIAHRKHEAAWTQAFIKAGYPHNLTISSVTGPDEDWFITGFDNYAQLEKLNEKMDTSPAFQKVMETFSPKETDFVAESRFIFAKYRPDLSYKTDFKLGEYKYFNVVTVRYKVGSGPDEIQKVLQAAREKANYPTPTVVYEITSGMPVGTFLYFQPIKSLADWDQPPNPAYGAALKEGNFMEAAGKTVQTAEYRLFSFNPKLSYVPESVAQANPSFWHPKTEVAKTTTPTKTTPAAKKETKAAKE